MKRLLFAILIVLVAWATPVFATDLPDSDPYVELKQVFRNNAESGDRTVVFLANIPYTTLPSDPVNQTYIWKLIDTDNTTVLGSTTGYAYNDSGYGWNVFSFYFSAADNLTWGQDYILRLSGNPAEFADPQDYDFDILSSDYTSYTTQADNQQALADWVIARAGELNVKWGLTTSESLVAEGDAATYLSVYGSTLFRGAIYGIQSLAPQVFDVQVSAVSITNRTFGTDYADNVTGQYSGTWIDTARDAAADLFGKDYDLLTIIIVLGTCIILIIGSIVLTGEAWSGLLFVAAALVVYGRLGFYPFVFGILIGAICILYTGAKLWKII